MDPSLINASATFSEALSIPQAGLALLLSATFGYLVSLVYRTSSNSVSGGRAIASTIMPLAITVCVIIAVVKSSLALSLGLVGALSIVRFRTPIKDPEDLIFLFLSIVVGLGFGANQLLYTSLGISFILLILYIRSNRSKKRFSRVIDSSYDLTLLISSNEGSQLDIASLNNKLSDFCSKISVLRFDSSPSNASITLHVNLRSGTPLDQLLSLFQSELNHLNIQVISSTIEW